MKKLMFAIGFAISLAGSSYAACVLGGAFCADDQGASVAGMLQDGNGSAIPVLSSSTIAGISPRAIGQEVMCNSTCATGKGVCISTVTGNTNAYVLVIATNTVCK